MTAKLDNYEQAIELHNAIIDNNLDRLKLAISIRKETD